MAGRGDALPVSAPSPTTAPGPPTPPGGRSATSPSRSRCGTPELCIQCGKCSLHCPHATIRTKLYDPAAARRRPADLQVGGRPRARRYAGQTWTVQVAPEDCTGCGECVEICPGKDKADPSRKAITHGLPAAAARAASGTTTRSSSASPIPTAPRCGWTPSRAASCCARCSSTPAPAPAAERPRTSSCSPSWWATVCSSAMPPAAPASTGATCPPPPTRKNDDGRGPTWNNSLFEDAAEFSYGLRLTVDKQTEFARELVAACGTIDRGRAGRRASWPPSRRTRPRSPPSGPGWSSSRPGVRGRPGGGNGADPRYAPAAGAWPTTWSRRASGASAATAGPSTSATAASTTSWPRSATSTCWCSTRRCTPTPAASAPRPRPWARWRCSPPAARPSARRTWAPSP